MKKTIFAPAFYKHILPATALALLTTACGTSRPLLTTENAKRIAAPAWMIGREIPAGSYNLTAFERIHKYNATVNLYIEGNTPAPDYPVGLHLASKDRADNVVYLAQPCQISGKIEKDEKCTLSGEQAYSPQSLQSFDDALDEIAARYDVRGFHLIGYDGGAAIAANLAASRKDILSIRTVAGILDTDAYNDAHAAPRTNNPQNPSKKADRLYQIPQYHFIGGQDTQVPPAILHAYLQSFPPTRCVKYEMIQENEHVDGWVEKWPELLDRPVSCDLGSSEAHNPLDLTTHEEPSPGSFMPEKPEKP